MKPYIISLEGNIGAGKSYKLEKMRAQYPTNIHGASVIYIPEPVEVWSQVQDSEGKNILKHYYDNQKRWGLTMQVVSLASRAELIKNALKQNPDIIIMERSIQSDKAIFAQMLYDVGIISAIEWNAYNLWYDHLLDNYGQIDLLVVLNSEIDRCSANIKHRNRDGEEEISANYLESLDNYIKDFYKKCAGDKVEIDAKEDIDINTLIQAFAPSFKKAAPAAAPADSSCVLL